MSATITELLDSKAESDDVGFERSWLSCQIERAFRFVEVLKNAAADPSNRSSIDPPLFRLSRSGSNSLPKLIEHRFMNRIFYALSFFCIY